MKIRAVDALVSPIQDRLGAWTFASGTVRTTPTLFVRLTSEEGREGFGCAAGSAPFVSGETPAGQRQALALLAPLLVDRDLWDHNLIARDIQHTLFGNNRLKTAVDMALWDLRARHAGKRVAELLGGAFREQVRIARVLRLADPTETGAQAAHLVGEGFTALKLKCGTTVAEDVTRVREVRRAAGADVDLIVDLDHHYDQGDVVRLLRQLEPLGVLLAEQPVAARQYAEARWVRGRVGIPIELDEGVETVSDVVEVIRQEAADSVNLRPGKVGGITTAWRMAGLCAERGLAFRVGQLPCSQLMDAAGLHLACAAERIFGPSELGEWARMEHDPATGLELAGGALRLPAGAGLGIAVSGGAGERWETVA